MLPARVVLVERAIEEVLASQRAMLGRRRTGVDEPDDAALGRALSAALETTRAGLAASPRVELFSLSHRALLEQTPRAIASLVDFLAATADPRRPEIPSEARVESTQHRDRGRAEGGLARLRTAMEGAVDRSLYRQRREAPSGGG